MGGTTISRRLARLRSLMAPTTRFLERSFYADLADKPGISNLALGNPHEMPLPALVEAFQHAIVPQNKDWYAYKMSEPKSQQVVAASLRASHGMAFEPDDILMTNGAFAALAVSLGAVVDPGDEVIFVSPPWFFYEAQIAFAGAAPVRVRVNPDTFDLDLDAIDRALSPRTRALIINSPHNPTGKIYSSSTLQGLSRLLREAGERTGRAIYLLSDESYNHIVYDNRAYPSPTAYYSHSLLLYTYGKTLLAPGQRIGYIALSPAMPERETLRDALSTTQLLTGYAFPNALLQHALPELESLSIDVAHLQDKRDWLVGALRGMGYEVHLPEGTFYLLPRSPWADDWAYAELLAEHDILVLPGTVTEMPGHFRLSLTASDEMIRQALPGFEAALRQARERPAGADDK
jgi:aspartate aminotransferase